MRTRLLVTGSAIALAMVILLLAIRAGNQPFAAQSHNPLSEKPNIVPIPPPEGGDAEPPGDGFRVEGPYEIRRKTESGKILILQASSYEPMPDGTVKVKKFKAQLYTPNQNLIDIRAESGQLYAPDQKLRNGTLKDNVLIRIFTNTDVNLLEPDSPHEMVRCLLDEARFEKEMSRIDSDSQVLLSTQRAEIRGQGLHITHSELDNQITKLTGFRRGVMRLLPGPKSSDSAAHTSSSPTFAKQAPSPKTKATPRAEKGDSPPPQLYLATFHDDVVIHNNFAVIHADQLQVVFDLSAGLTRDNLLNQVPQAPSPVQPERHCFSPMQWPGGFQHAVFAQVISAMLVNVVDTSTAARRPTRSLTTGHEDQTTIAWRGQMTVVPVEPDAPESADLEGPGDMLVMLRGKPVRITTKDDHTVRAATVDYLMSTGRLRLTASAQHPLIDSRSIGVEIRATKLVIDQARGTGVFTGPGVIRAHDDPTLIAAMEPEGTLGRSPKRLPAGTVIHWADALDLSFYKQEAPSHTSADPIQIAVLRDAVFRGNVMLRHPAVDLDADRLSVDLDNPDDGQQIIHRILAAGNVIVAAESNTEPKPIHIQSDWLTMHLERGADGGMQPTRFEASGEQTQVIAVHEGMKLSAGKLYVALSKPPSPDASLPLLTRPENPKHTIEIAAPPLFNTQAAMDEPSTEPAHEPAPSYLPSSARIVGSQRSVNNQINVAVELLIAEQDVRIEFSAKDQLITADRAVVNVPAKRLELYGTDDQMARLTQPAGMFEGQYVVMVEATETARAIGPGRAMFFDTPRPVLTVTDRSRTLTPAALDVAWQDSMQFDNASGLAQFVGHVEVRSTLDKDTLNLSSNDLRIQFLDVVRTNPNAASSSPRNQAANSSLKQLNASQRTIKSLEARGDMTFLAESWVDRPGGNLATSIVIMGPSLKFLDITEQVKVPGPGSMVFVDQRPEKHNSRVSGDSTEPLVRFAGRGNTLFEWSGDLTLDANRNDMLLRDQVKMTHLVSASDEALIMDCQRFLADLEATSGLKVWLGGNVPRPAVKFVKADGNVRVLRGRLRIATDHLKYTGSNEMIRLDADEGWTTQISAPGGPSLSARSILWYLRTSRFRVTDLGPVQLGQ